MRLGTTSLSVTRSRSPRAYAAAAGVTTNFADISDYSHVRFDRINVATSSFVTGVTFNSTGTIMYTVDSSAGRPVKSQSLSTAWDISTAGSATATVNLYDATDFTSPHEVRFKPDGTKMYACDAFGNIREYSLQSAYSLTNMGSYTAQRDFGSRVHGFVWKPDGTALFTIDSSIDRIKRHALATAWDITSTITLTQSIDLDLSTTANETANKSMFLSPDGLKLYFTGIITDKVHMYNLATAWDITSSSFSGTPDDYLDISSQETSPQCITFSDDGKHLYVGGATDDGVDQYTRP